MSADTSDEEWIERAQESDLTRLAEARSKDDSTALMEALAEVIRWLPLRPELLEATTELEALARKAERGDLLLSALNQRSDFLVNTAEDTSDWSRAREAVEVYTREASKRPNEGEHRVQAALCSAVVECETGHLETAQSLVQQASNLVSKMDHTAQPKFRESDLVRAILRAELMLAEAREDETRSALLKEQLELLDSRFEEQLEEYNQSQAPKPQTKTEAIIVNLSLLFVLFVILGAAFTAFSDLWSVL